MQHKQWVLESKPSELPGDWCLSLLNSGYCYISGRDKCYRPVIVVNVATIKAFTAA